MEEFFQLALKLVRNYVSALRWAGQFRARALEEPRNVERRTQWLEEANRIEQVYEEPMIQALNQLVAEGKTEKKALEEIVRLLSQPPRLTPFAKNALSRLKRALLGSPRLT